MLVDNLMDGLSGKIGKFSFNLMTNQHSYFDKATFIFVYGYIQNDIRELAMLITEN